MRKTLLLLVMVLTAIGLMLPVAAQGTPYKQPVDPSYEIVVPLVDNSIKLYDFADLFTPEEEDRLNEKIQRYRETLSLDLVVVTTDDAAGLSAMEYADDFYDYNGYGLSEGSTTSEQNNGSLLLIDMDNRTVWMSTHMMAQTVYRDEMIEQILDAAFEYMPDGEYYQAMDAAIDEALLLGIERYEAAAKDEVGRQEIHEGIDEAYDTQQDFSALTKELKGPAFQIQSRTLLIALAPASILALVVVGILLGTHRKSLSGPPSTLTTYVGEQGIANTGQIDMLVDSHISRRRLPEQDSSSGGSGGGFGSGGSSHSSSSGSSHGGGGRSF